MHATQNWAAYICLHGIIQTRQTPTAPWLKHLSHHPPHLADVEGGLLAACLIHVLPAVPAEGLGPDLEGRHATVAGHRAHRLPLTHLPHSRRNGAGVSMLAAGESRHADSAKTCPGRCLQAACRKRLVAVLAASRGRMLC